MWRSLYDVPKWDQLPLAQTDVDGGVIDPLMKSRGNFIFGAIPKWINGKGGLFGQFGLFLKRNAKYLYLHTYCSNMEVRQRIRLSEYQIVL